MEPVTISLADLSTPHARNAIACAFGSTPGCLGVIVISDLPSEFAARRVELFHLINRFASMPEATREKLARKDSSYCFGWSHGKETMNGVGWPS